MVICCVVQITPLTIDNQKMIIIILHLLLETVEVDFNFKYNCRLFLLGNYRFQFHQFVFELIIEERKYFVSMFLLLFFLMMMRMTEKIFVMMFLPPPLLMTILMKMTGRNSIKNTREVRMVFASQSFFGMLELFDHRVDFLQNYKTMRVVLPSLEW